MIRVSDLSVTFGHGRTRIEAVRGVDFHVEDGETFGLVGESGSGKSTVLNSIAGLLDRWAGAIILDGVAVDARRSKAQRKLVQMVFQDPYGSLHPRHTVDRVLSEPAEIHGFDDIERRVVQTLTDVGLGPAFRFRFPHQLSGGQRQRVAIARALILEPRILLLDEPTSALDVSVQAEILNLLRRLRQERGLTMLMVSHNLAVIAFMCDRLAVMQRGRIVETMTAAQLNQAEPTHAYSRQLLHASQGYDRAAVDMFEDL